MANDEKERDRQRYVSVGVSFGDVAMIERHGSGVSEVTCPACGARGRRLGNPGEDFRFEGFSPLSAGGVLFILAECDACKQSVTLPHRRSAR